MRKFTHNFNQLCSKIFLHTHTHTHNWTTAYLGAERIHLGDVFFLRDTGVSDTQMFRIYNLVSKYTFTK